MALDTVRYSPFMAMPESTVLPDAWSRFGLNGQKMNNAANVIATGADSRDCVCTASSDVQTPTPN